MLKLWTEPVLHVKIQLLLVQTDSVRLWPTHVADMPQCTTQNTSSHFKNSYKGSQTHTDLLGVLKPPPFFWVFYSKSQWKQLFMFWACNDCFSEPEQQCRGRLRCTHSFILLFFDCFYIVVNMKQTSVGIKFNWSIRSCWTEIIKNFVNE